ncbi:MAG: hypothetical protein PHE83_15015 [Opitutaceae bacterium]|nr:hypothetical protein [Opitutaceae bacterium]
MSRHVDRIIPLKPVPPPGGYIFPLPLNDLQDILKIGAKYQRRWFSSEITVPTGILAWIGDDILAPFGHDLAAAVSIAGYPATMEIINHRYVINGRGLDEPPVCVSMPSCPPLGFNDLIHGMDRALKPGLEHDAVYWVDFFRTHIPDALIGALRTTHRLNDVMR